MYKNGKNIDSKKKTMSCLFTSQRVPVHGLVIVALYWLTAWYVEIFSTNNEEWWNWTCWYKVAWTFPTFYALVSFVGLNIPERPNNNDAPDRDIIKICIVTKGTNLEALRRTLQTFSWLERDDENQNNRTQLYVVIDDGPYKTQIAEMIEQHIYLVVVPSSFRTQHAKYKSRALEYFRLHYVHNTDWVLHMDEESTMDKENFEACRDFARANQYDIGQGVIYYNACHYNQWTFTSKLITVADTLRVADDLGRFRFQYHLLHRPIFGLHGSFLMIRGSVENAVTWDHVHADNLTEDYAFAMQLDKKITCGPIRGIVREVSPQSIRDFMKQRRRWFIGIWTLPYFWPRFMCFLWTLGSITFLVTYLHIILTLTLNNVPTTPMWLGALSTFSFVTSVYMYTLGLLLQHVDYLLFCKSKNWLFRIVYVVGHFVLAIPLFVCSSVLETVCIYYSLVTKPKTFDVVKK